MSQEIHVRRGAFARSAILYGTAGALGKATALIAVPYLTRQLGPQGYGLVDLATSLSALLVLFLRFAGDIPTMRMAAREDVTTRGQTNSAFLVATVVISVAGAGLLLPVSEVIAADLWSSPGSTELALWSLVLVPINATQAALVNVLRFAERPRAFAVVAAADVFAQVGLAVLFVASGAGPTGVLVGYAVGGILGVAIAAAAAAQHLAAQIDFRRVGKIVVEGIPFLPAVVAFYVADTIGRVLAANSLGVAAVGEIGLAIRFASIMALASGAFSTAWGPFALALRPGPSTTKVLSSVFAQQTAIVGLVSLCLGAFGPELSVAIGGSQFVGAGVAVPGLLLSSGLAGVLYVLTTAAGITYRGQWVAAGTLAGGVAQVVATAGMLPILGVGGFVLGAVVGRLVGLAVLWPLVSDVVQRTWLTVAVIAGAAGATFAVQVLNLEPQATVPFRIAIAASALGILVLVLRAGGLGPRTWSWGEQ